MKVKFIASISILLLFVLIYCFYNQSSSFDELIFKGVDKNYITQIRVGGNNLEEDKKIKDKNDIQEILSELSKLNLRQCSKFPTKGRSEAYDINFSNGNKYISYDGAEKISNVEITFYNTGYIILYGEGVIKSKYYKIDNSSEIKRIEENISRLIQ